MEGSQSTANPLPAPPLAPEQLGPFTLVARLGAGGMGEGYLAVRLVGEVDQRVFVKRILPEYRADPKFLKLFGREAAIVASLNHQNIVPLLEADPQGRFLAFVLVEGVDLRELLMKQPEHQLPVEHTVFIAIRLLSALKHAHTRTRGGQRAGVIHRDLTPHNVLISYEGAVLVTDFGVASVLRETKTLTHVAGKDEYRSPEESDGGVVDQRSDLFSLGVMLYEMLAGRKPYEGTQYQIARAIAAGQHKPLAEAAPHVPAALCAIVEKLLAPAPGDRYQHAADVLAAMHKVLHPAAHVEAELGNMVWRVRSRPTIETSWLRELVNRASFPPADHDGDVHAPPGTVSASPVDASSNTAAGRAQQRGRWFVGAGAVAATAVLGVLLANVRTRPSAPDDHPPAPETSQHTTTTAAPASTSPPPAPGAVLTTEPPAIAPRDEAAAPEAQQAPAADHTERGSVRVRAFPDLQVWVDHSYAGWTPRSLSLPAGSHFISVGRDDREELATQKKILVRPGDHSIVRF